MLHPNLPITATSLPRPLPLVPKEAIVEDLTVVLSAKVVEKITTKKEKWSNLKVPTVSTLRFFCLYFPKCLNFVFTSRIFSVINHSFDVEIIIWYFLHSLGIIAFLSALDKLSWNMKWHLRLQGNFMSVLHISKIDMVLILWS